MYGDGAAHHIHDVLCNGHPESGALNAADRAALFAGEGFEDRFLKLLTHADAVVLDPEFENRFVRGGGRLFDHAEADHAAVRRELDGV